MPFWQFFRKGWDGRALLVRPSKIHHSIWKILFVFGADEYLERLEGKIRKCLFFYVKIFSNNSVTGQGTWGFKKYSYIWYLYWNEKENKTAVSGNIFHQYVPIVRVLPLHFVVWREFTREFRFSKKSAVAKIVHSTFMLFSFQILQLCQISHYT